MLQRKGQAGFSTAMIIVIIAVVIVVGLGVYYAMKQSSDAYKTSDASNSLMQPAAPTPAASNTAADSSGAMTFSLNEESKSGEQGTVTLTPVGNQTKVVVSVTGAPKTAQPDHIHTGSCPTPGGIKYNLNDVVNGQSETVLQVSLSDILNNGPVSINVHKSATDLMTYVACADLTAVTKPQPIGAMPIKGGTIPSSPNGLPNNK